MHRIALCLSLALSTSLLACHPGATPHSMSASEPDTTVDGRVYPYLHVDVFTDSALSGNQLAVFLMPEGLTDREMQDMAREINFSETTFVFPAESEDADFRVRIFARNREMDFAGHPTIGTAYALAHAGLIEAGRERVVLGEGIGPVPVDLDWDGEALRFAWMHQLEPEFGNAVEDRAGFAAALGVEESQLVPSLPVQSVSCGSSFVFAPLTSREAVDAAVVHRAAMVPVLEAAGLPPRGIFIFSTAPGDVDDDATVYSRMLGMSGFEDPATGSASGPLGAYLVHHGVVAEEDASAIVSRQGVAMARPSRVHIDIGLESGAIRRVRVGGTTVFVGNAEIRLP